MSASAIPAAFAHRTHGIARAFGALLIIACLLCGRGAAADQPPAGASSPATPDSSTHAPDRAGTPQATAAAVSTTPAAVDKKQAAACEGYVAVLSGRKTDAAALGNASLRTIAAPDLVMCGAVFSDSDAMCQRLMPAESGPGGACLHTQSIFHELRAYPNSHAFMFDDVDFTDCHGVPGLETYCTSLRKALRSGNPKDCAQVAGGESICRAYMSADKSLCIVTGKLATLEVELPGKRKPGDPTKAKVKEWIEETCRSNIESRAFLGKGLKAIAESGPTRERELAKAALKQDEACQRYAQAAIQNCMAPTGSSTPGGTAANAPATPGAAAPPAAPPNTPGAPAGPG
jgi:hypothetical protein